MIIADSNAIIKNMNGPDKLDGLGLIVPDDLYTEYLVAEIRHGASLPKIQMASTLKGFDESAYLREYIGYLNSYTQMSIAKMRGLADVSILALVKCIATDFGRRNQQVTLDFDSQIIEKLTVISSDGKLTKKLKEEFDGLIDLVEYDKL
jgi:hypothetical protein